MNSRQIAYTLTTLLARLDKYGTPVDADTRAALDKGLEEAAAVLAWRPDAGGDTIARAYAALVAGRDPGTDKAVLAAIVSDRLQDLRAGIHTRAGDTLAGVVADHLSHIVAALAGAYGTHVAETVVRAAGILERVGITPSADPAVVLGHDAEVMTAWADMTRVRQTHADILGLYGSLRVTFNIGSAADQSLHYVDPNGHTLHEVRDLGQSPSPWSVVTAGMRLGLATPAEALARQDAANRATAEGLARV